MSGKRSRTKGHQFERDIANKFKELGFKDARRQLEYHSEDAQGIDIQNAGPWEIQCKAYKDYAPISKIEEIKSKGGIPALITKGDRKKPVIVMYLEDFEEGMRDIAKFYEGRS